MTIAERPAPRMLRPAAGRVIAAAPEAAASPLVCYALQGLRRCWMPDRGRFSFRYNFDAAGSPNESVSQRDAFYTLNVLLGSSRLTDAGFDYLNAADTYKGCCRLLGSPDVRIYMLGMALWAGAKLGIDPPGGLVDRVRAILASPGAIRTATAQDIGMMLSGITALAIETGREWRPTAEILATRLSSHYYSGSGGIFYNQDAGWRRRFSSFASQVYAILALYQFGEAFDPRAVDLANAAVARIIALQGPGGEWGWFYDARRGLTVDFYEVYSVHQHGMAPAFLHRAAAHGVPGAREALRKGFLWLFGGNEMGVSMLRPQERMFYRSQARAGELAAVRRRGRRALVNAALGRADSVGNHRRLAIRRECRSYELGWILWSFGGCGDYPDLTERPEFAP